ncbi:hypothetical protein BBO99_00003984 [Phytophthora kernoviae]|uniref:Uncharacterized protein n=2 Tax=Phytophthora kernoviae TaxID=325452 RepID=A0A421F9M1_9STRA|nr:hypothetical protein G195_004461 [Phytophthora kernoviae 00238/432]KAG2526421.1 hypothetical protein JM16_003805 [Phytophthora kernoviae]KAG2528065.1 hypothetical protein JM18_003385 [Phytophthora kernoviae]RLN31974.1 hypothetical protein BBI17_004005 [Phytophthora kernoviae]RLN81120.1 hypothetical protein BBO99_00003984 [Phytophthora kernoviae]
MCDTQFSCWFFPSDGDAHDQGLKHYQQDPYGYNDGSLDGLGSYVGYGDRSGQDEVDDYSGNDSHDDHGYHHSQGYGANGHDTPNHD